MKTRNEMLEKGLASIDPLVGEDLDQLASGSEADELLAAILSSDARTGGKPARRVPSRVSPHARRRRMLAAIPLAAVALGASIVGIPGNSNNAPDTLPALARVAEAAAAQPPLNTDLPYLYVKTREMNMNTSVAGGQAWSVYQSSLDEKWIAKDGSGRVRRVLAPPRWVSPKDKEAWEAAGKINFLAFGWASHSEEEDVSVGHFGQLFGGAKLSELPTDPTELAAWLEDRVTDQKVNAGAGNGFPVSVRTLTLTSEILNDPLASPELRAALYEAEGMVPGIEYLGNTTDAIGRQGVAVGAESANSGAPTLYSLIFDPKTSQVLATEQTTPKPPTGLPGEKTPLLTEAKLFIESGSTRSLSEKPRGIVGSRRRD